MNPVKTPLIVLGCGLLLSACAQPRQVELPAPIAPFPAVAMAVESGDSVVLRHTRTQRIERVRLEGVDAPESGQPYGLVASAALLERVRGVSLVVSATAREADGSLRGYVCVAEAPFFADWTYPPCEPEASINQDLTQAGHVWVTAAGKDAPALAAAETRARGGRTGLWAAEAPVPPWQWRALSPERRSSILAAATGTSPAAHAPGSTYAAAAPGALSVQPGMNAAMDVDYSWLFGVAPESDDAESFMNADWVTDWRALIGEFF